MIRTTDPIYEAAIAEVRGHATEAQTALLEADIVSWLEALQVCLDEVDSQFPVKETEFEDRSLDLDEDDEEGYQAILDEWRAWQANARTFRRHIDARRRSVERKAGGQQDHSALIDAVANLYEADPDQGYGEAEIEEAIMVVLDVYERDYLR